jgi:peptide deformylase
MKIIDAHRKISRKVKSEDMSVIMSLRNEMFMLCFKNIGNYKGAYAVAHCQVKKINPMRFFVTREGKTIVNPKIVRHSGYMVDSFEGCLSYPLRNQVMVQRYRKIEVEYLDKDFKKKVAHLSGQEAFVWQHEIDHFDGKHIYD